MKSLTQDEAREILKKIDLEILDLIERARETGVDPNGRFITQLKGAEWSVSQARTRASELPKGDSDVK